MIALIIPVIVIVLALMGSSFRLVQQYEQGVVLRFGRLLPVIREPGLRSASAMLRGEAGTIVTADGLPSTMDHNISGHSD
jgi:regulator of protease activity HflC (stomatin/prohibitin superfamily)